MGQTAPLKPRIHLHPSWLLWLSLLFYFRVSLVFPFLLAAVLHELSHYFMLLHLKKPPIGVTLTCSGILMETPPLSYREELITAAAGPLSSILLGLIFLIAPTLALYGVCLGLFNLLPIPGLDGGRMLSAFFHLKFDDFTADQFSCLVGLLTAGFLCLQTICTSVQYGLGLWPILIAALFLIRVIQIWRL